MGVTKLPFAQIYKGTEGNVEQFAMNMSAPGLKKLRTALDGRN